MKKKPVIGITLGDPAGIGPEVAVLAAINAKVRRACVPVFLGDARILRRAMECVECEWDLESLRDEKEITPEVCRGTGKRLLLLELGGANPKELPWGRLSALAGRAAYQWVLAGARLAMKGTLDALVTAPLNKEAVQKAGIKHFQGHTELLAELSGVKEFAMMLAGGGLRVVLVTTHESIKSVPRLLKKERILEKIGLAHRALTRSGGAKPRIAVCALNPHAGEGGAFGREEIELIEPAIREARKQGYEVSGPFAADTLFARQKKDRYDAIVCMYHDQGLIPLKLLSFGKGVNITLGLPFVRTSPDHGTAFDLAGTGKADAGSMIAAVLEAAGLVGA